ncbi:MAG: hypothetical protein VX700_02930 [Pseudomonadota bacterium]|nr:hypothetical protein [Pseudomonadota bacterium]
MSMGQILTVVVVAWRFVRRPSQVIDGVVVDLAKRAGRVNLGRCQMGIAV